MLRWWCMLFLFCCCCCAQQDTHWYRHDISYTKKQHQKGNPANVNCSVLAAAAYQLRVSDHPKAASHWRS